MSASSLRWLALIYVLLGAVLIAYSARERTMVLETPVETQVERVKTPWEILATPIRVPGIDYIAGGNAIAHEGQTLAESMREIDKALSYERDLPRA